MNIKTLPVSYPLKATYNIDSNFKVTITVMNNPFEIPLDSLFEMAMRENKKRGFLFVSKILGKHLAVNPHVSLVSGAILAAGYLKTVYNIDYPFLPELIKTISNQERAESDYRKVMDNLMHLPEQTLFLGFAETATALGYSIFNCFADKAWYIHTTRDYIPELELQVSFEEEHSHAVSHRCYTLNQELFAGKHPVVFVDDELTTGKTVLNIIRAIQQKFPRQEYAVLSYLDWRSERELEQFRLIERELGISIRTFSILSGTIEVEGEPSSDNYENTNHEVNATSFEILNISEKYEAFNRKAVYLKSQDSHGFFNAAPYLSFTGRFGVAADERKEVEVLACQIGKRLQQKRQGSRALCLGTGEFMYFPMRIASFMGEGVVYHSTTRSPIRTVSRPDYLIRNRFSFTSPDDPDIVNYFYNIPKNFYDELYIFMERDWPERRLQPLQKILQQLRIPRVYMIICGGRRRGNNEQTDQRD